MSNTTMPAIEKRDAIRAFRSANDHGRKMLQELYPGFKFNQDPTEWVKTWEDVCEAYMLLDNRETDEPAKLPYSSPVSHLQRYINGCHMVAITVHVMNDGKIPDKCDGREKYRIWWECGDKESGFRFAYTHGDWSLTTSYVGPRLEFYSRSRAEYSGRVLTSIFKEMFGQPSTVQATDKCSSNNQ